MNNVEKNLGSVLHIVAGNFDNIIATHGSKKDILNRIDYFKSNSISYTTIYVKDRSDLALLNFFKASDLTGVKYILYEHSRYPSTISYIRRHTDIKQVLRAHNAEFYHSLQTAVAALELSYTSLRWRIKLAKRYLNESIKKLFNDIRIAANVDFILTINPYEHKIYWRYISAKRKIKFLPYYTNNSLYTGAVKQNDFLIMGSAHFNPLAWNNVIKMYSLYGAETSNDGVVITTCGDYKYKPLLKQINKFKSIKYLGVVHELDELVVNTKILLHPSNLGMGFKTKIHDVIVNGGMVAIHKKFLKKIPYAYHSRILFLDDFSSLTELSKAFVYNATCHEEINSLSARYAKKLLDQLFVNVNCFTSNYVRELKI